MARKAWLKTREELVHNAAYKEWLKNPRSPLPLRIVTEIDETYPYIQLIEHVVKRHASNIIAGHSTDFREELRKAITQIQSEAYERGLKTANKIIEL